MDYCMEPNNTVTYREGVLYNENTFACDREKGHIGQHQAIVDQYNGRFTMAAWDEGFLFVKVDCVWSTKHCADCSFTVDADSEPGKRCNFCSFYHEIEQDSEIYTIDGTVFRAVDYSWADERVIKVISKNGVTEITRRLLPVVELPANLRFRFPNNAVFKPVQYSPAISVYIPYGDIYEGEDAKEIVADYEDWS